MRWSTVVVVATLALALALVGAGCGGDDEEASDTTTLTDAVTDDTTTDDTTTDETTTDTDGSDDFDLASGECAELVEAGTKLSEAFGAVGGSDSDFDDVSTFFDEFADTAPEEIRADFQILADAWDEYADILPDLQVEPGETPDPEALAQLQQALAAIDQEEVAAASERISAWAEANC